MLDAVLSAVRLGEGRSLVLRGEGGIGKTALLEYLIESAPDMTLLRATGVESEMELAYAGLHQLCAPLLDRLPGLPPPQSEALKVVFGLIEGEPPDRFLVGLGVLSLLSAASEQRPLLCVVDDVHWLDQASALTLAFVARRLLAEQVGIVFATRLSDDELQHLDGLEVQGLRNGDARALLGTAVQFMLDERVRDRIIAETRGNPLTLLELPRGLSAAELAVGFGLADAQAIPGRIEESFMRRIAALGDDARRLLLLAAAEPLGDPGLLRQAAQRLGIATAASSQAENAGLLAIGARVTFHHPLVRSAAYRSAAVEDRQAVHLALAEVTDAAVDPDRRAWHLAGATTGPDEAVATELERSAGRVQARGGVSAAAAFLQRSVALTLDPVRRAARSLAAAQAQLQAGAFDAALRLAASAEAGPLDDLGRARVDLLRAQVAFAATRGGEALAPLMTAAHRLESLDPELARETYLDAWAAGMLSGRAGAETLPEVCRAALSAPQPDSSPRLSDLLLEGLSLLVIKGNAGVPKLRQAVSAYARGETDTADAMRWGWHAAMAAAATWDLEHWQLIDDRLAQAAREAGLLIELQIHLTGLGMVATLCGDFAAAASYVAEVDAVAAMTGSRLFRYAAVQLAGWRGREAEASRLMESEARDAVGQSFALTWCQWASAVLHNGLGQYERALAAAQHASEVRPELDVCARARVELIEAATRTGQTQLAVETLERLAEAARVGETDWGLGLYARSLALVSEGGDAEDAYQEAIKRLSRTRLAPEVGRAHLVYGEWLRRENRRLDARGHLRSAYEVFSAIGMEAFAQRAQTELRATGERVRAQSAQTRDDLTLQERQIAELARDGLSNPEIGARLFLSPRTVEWHLRHVFMKLGIKSRRELATALPGPSSDLMIAGS